MLNPGAVTDGIHDRAGGGLNYGLPNHKECMTARMPDRHH